MGNFGPIVAEFYASLYLKICSRDFSQTLQDDKAQNVDEKYLSEISQKFFFGQNRQLWPYCGTKLYKPISQDLL